MARPYYERDEGDWRERDERRYRYGGQERGRYDVSGDWDRDRYREAPEYGRDQNYGWSSDRNYNDRHDDEHRAREYWRARENPPFRTGDSWNANDAWRSGGSRSDYDRYTQGGQGRQYGQYGQSYGSRTFGHDYGPNENFSSERRFREPSERDTLRGIGSGNDEQRWGGSAFQGFGHHSSSNEQQPRHGSFAGKGPKGYTRSDDRIREDVCDRLSADDEVDASDITVTVTKGEVTLEGTVSDRHCKRRAEDISESVNGVSEVHNRLRANKGLMQEVGDKLMGRSNDTGHSGSGTRNAPSGTTTGYQNNH